jgi:murein L,D-transpeptidase YafK
MTLSAYTFRRFFVLLLLSPTLALATDSAKPVAPKVDRILILKSERTMHLMAGEKVLKTYKVALGTQPVGAKERQGDGKTPEGKYVINWKNPKSQFHLSLHISYPNAADRARAKKLGVHPGGRHLRPRRGQNLRLAGRAAPPD